MHARHSSPARISITLFCLAFFLQLSACTEPALQGPKASPAEHREQARRLVQEKRFIPAAMHLKSALKTDPNIADALNCGDLFEAGQNFSAARSCYQLALPLKGSVDEEARLRYRLALLEAAELDNPLNAREYLHMLPPESDRATDLASVLALKQGDAAQARKLSRLAVQRSTENATRGWAYYHQAQAWLLLNDESEAFSALFHAINHARSPGLVDRITRLWNQLRQD